MRFPRAELCRSVFFLGLGISLPILVSAWRTAALEDRATDRRSREVEVVERVQSAIVSVDAIRDGGTVSAGSGVIVNGRGYLLSNHHVVRGAESIRVQLATGETWPARIVAASRANDLALLELASGRKSDFPYVAMGSSDDLLPGETVLAMGSPYGLRHTISRGVISAVRRSVRLPDGAEYHDFIQTDAAINPGNSGGGLINLSGELVGVNAAIFHAGWGIAFAIPVDRIKELLESYVRKEHALGLRAERTDDGLVVRELSPGGVAEEAGIRLGDVLLYGNGQRLRDEFDLVTASLGSTDSNPLRLHLSRSGRELAMDLRGVSLLWARLGLRSSDDELREGEGRRVTGVRVDDLDPDGRAARAGLLAGDVILEAGVATRDAKETAATFRIYSEDDMLLVLERYPTRPLELQIVRDGHRQELALP